MSFALSLTGEGSDYQRVDNSRAVSQSHGLATRDVYSLAARRTRLYGYPSSSQLVFSPSLIPYDLLLFPSNSDFSTAEPCSSLPATHQTRPPLRHHSPIPSHRHLLRRKVPTGSSSPNRQLLGSLPTPRRLNIRLTSTWLILRNVTRRCMSSGEPCCHDSFMDHD